MAIKVGDHIGYLVVLEETDERWHGAIVCRCLCELCGRTDVILSKIHLRGKQRNIEPQGCGCIRLMPENNYNNKTNKIDLTGKWFGHLEVLKDNGRSKHHDIIWQCKCHFEGCGNIVNVLGSNLRAGHTKRCNNHIKNTKMSDMLSEAKEENNGVIPFFLTQKKRSTNKSGYKGVAKLNTKAGVRYRAYLTVAGKPHRGHRFETPEEAYEERLEMEKKYVKPLLEKSQKEHVPENKNKPPTTPER